TLPVELDGSGVVRSAIRELDAVVQLEGPVEAISGFEGLGGLGLDLTVRRVLLQQHVVERIEVRRITVRVLAACRQNRVETFGDQGGCVGEGAAMNGCGGT